MAADKTEDRTGKKQDDTPDTLPMSKDVSQTAPATPKKNINDTIGGRIAHFLTFYVVGFFMNSSLSLFITYNLNPRNSVKKFKEGLSNSIGKVFGGTAGSKTVDSVRSAIEITFMMISGTIITGIMTPLLKYQGRIAHAINRALGKDADVLPPELQKQPEPKTVEEKISQEITKRVKKDNAGLAALWLSRIGLTGAVLAGDAAVNRGSRILESKNLPSVDTLSWGAGKQVYKVLPKSLVARWSNWFGKHGASLDQIKANMGDHFTRLETHGKVGSDENSMVIAEQSRLLIKELGWTFIMAKFMETLTGSIRKTLTHRQEKKAIKDMKEEGIVPEGHNVLLQKDGSVRLERIEDIHTEKKTWAVKKDASSSRVEALEKSRATTEAQPMAPGLSS